MIFKWIGGSVRVLQRDRTNRMCKEIYYKELAHRIMEAEKYQSLQEVNWRHREGLCRQGQILVA